MISQLKINNIWAISADTIAELMQAVGTATINGYTQASDIIQIPGDDSYYIRFDKKENKAMAASEYRDDTVYYYCDLCDWQGTDDDANLTLDGITCPNCTCLVMTDHDLHDDIGELWEAV